MAAVRILNIVRVILLLFIVIATAVGISGHVVEDKDNNDIFVSLWKVHAADGSKIDIDDVGCDTLRNRFRGVAGISIIALIFYFAMFIISIIDLIKDHINKIRAIIFNVLNFIAFVFIMTSWAAEGHFYHSDWCAGFRPKDANYEIAYGLALLVVVWVIQIVMTIIWIVTKILDNKKHKNEPTAVRA